MPETHAYQEEAARYVLDELSPPERRRFQAELAQSAELRALVHQLEEGALALALASKRRQAPPEVWQRIERELNRKPHLATFLGFLRWLFWRSGWAFAGICITGWILYAAYAHRGAGTADSPATAFAQSPAQTALVSTVSPAPVRQPPPTTPEDSAAARLLQARTRELAALHWQLADLSNRTVRLSQAVTQQQALLSSPSHFRFFQLTPGSGAELQPVPISTNLQRALLLAMARELGWQAPVASPQAQNNSGNSSEPSQSNTNQTAVEFVDLRAGSNEVVRSSAPLPPSTETTAQTSSSIPGFVSGTNAVLAFDASVVPSGNSLSFWTTSSSGQYQSLGGTTVGDHPVVVTVPFSTMSWGGGNVMVVSEGAGGSNLFQFTIPGNSP